MSNNILEFLVELPESQSLAALRSAHNEASILVFKTDSHPNPIKAKIESFIDKKTILQTDPPEAKIALDKELSIKFNVGTEIFFVKTMLQKHMNRYFFDMHAKVIQLKRRKEPRFTIPKKWTQSAFINLDKQSFACRVQDISLSGLRLEVLEKCPVYKREDQIKIKFQIYKRSEVQATATVKFALFKEGLNPILGLELTEISEAHKQKVEGIVEDILTFNTYTKNS